MPGDPGQVIYVWWDALGNYVTALGYGTGGELYRRWWDGAGRRIHLVGKGVVRFHAVYWPAILLSAGLPLPTDIGVHDYLTIERAQDQQVGGGGGASLADPAALAAEFGTDAVRWWLLREVPRVGDADFTVARLVARANDDLANGLGNLVSRVTSMTHRYRHGRVPAAPGAGPGVSVGPLPGDDAEPAARRHRRRRPGDGRPAARCLPEGAGPGQRRAGRLRLPGGDHRHLDCR